MPSGVYSRVGRYGTTIERFERQVTKTADGCWIWSGAVGVDGYGKFFGDGRLLHAHRWYWMHLRGQLPSSISVLHRCDTPLCVNPDHLFTGTTADNMADKVKKQRQARGSRNGRAKLTEAIVLDARRERNEAGTSFARLAAKYGVSKVAMRNAVTGKAYAHL